MRQPTILLLIWALLLAATGPEPTPRHSKDHALFFAIQDYDHWTDLKNPIRDAEAIAQNLRTNYGFDDLKIVTNPTLETIQATLNEYLTKTYGTDDQLFVFFSGHGTFNDLTTEGFFIPKGGLKNDPYQNSYLPLTRLERTISNIPCAHILLTIDACYSGTFNESIALDKSDPTNPTWLRPGVDPGNGAAQAAWIAAKLAKRSRICVTSGGKERTSDGIKHSPMTEAFLKGLANPGEDAILTVDELVAGLKNLYPTPKTFSFGIHQSDGSFLFIRTINELVDTDRDGIPDTRDECPNQYGSSSNNGCPPSLIIPEGMVQIKGGDFELGDVMGDQEEVRAGIYPLKINNFLLAKSELTFDEFDAFCDATGRKKPSDDGWGRGKLPVFNVTWYDAVEYCNWRSTQEGFQAFYKIDKSLKDINNMAPDEEKKWLVTINPESKGYRLPTEAEWEYAARQGGRKVRFGNGKNIADPKEINFNGSESYKKAYSVIGEYRQRPLPVASLFPNDLQLHDMSGNVWEWCWNWYSIQKEENGPISGSARVVKGGSCYDPPEYIRANYCFYYAPDYYSNRVGFRLAKY